MKRMNLKKALSLMSFVLIMFFGVQTASAQMVESDSAIELINARLNSLSSQNGTATQPTSATAASEMETVVEIKYLQVVAGEIKGGASTMNAINSAYSQYTVNLSGARLALMNAVKQNVIATLNTTSLEQ